MGQVKRLLTPEEEPDIQDDVYRQSLGMVQLTDDEVEECLGQGIRDETDYLDDEPTFEEDEDGC